MPTYDYECDSCEHSFELFQQISESPKRKCPECGKMKLRRLFGTGAAVVFKGSGFYQTDYRSEAYKKAADADKKASSESSSSKDSKSSDSKSSDSKGSTKSDSGSSSKPKKESKD